jgi:hypothetical protein
VGATDGLLIGRFSVAAKFRFAFPPVIAASPILALLLPAGSSAQQEEQWCLDTVFSIGEERKLPKDVIPGSDVIGW